MIKVTKAQILKINKVDGKGWGVFADVSEVVCGVSLHTEQLFKFYTKKEAAQFIEQNA